MCAESRSASQRAGTPSKWNWGHCLLRFAQAIHRRQTVCSGWLRSDLWHINHFQPLRVKIHNNFEHVQERTGKVCVFFSRTHLETPSGVVEQAEVFSAQADAVQIACTLACQKHFEMFLCLIWPALHDILGRPERTRCQCESSRRLVWRWAVPLVDEWTLAKATVVPVSLALLHSSDFW